MTTVNNNIQGQSLVLNALLIAVNLTGLVFVAMGYHAAFENSKWLWAGMGYGLMALSTIGLIILKGRLFMAMVSRLLVGSLFIVSGLIKANDPIGFGYKLEEYFQDGALAFRIKEWFGMPGFSLEFLIEWATELAVIICVVEIVLGVLVLIGGRIKLVSWLLLLMMLFFTFLTWHTANCSADMKFTDRDTYEMTDPVAQMKIDEAKTNKDIKIISKTSSTLVVDERKQPQCVLDCGCFGDAMKGSIGRSLTPSESLWKDIVLVYLVIWIFVAQRKIKPNTRKENMWTLVVATLLTIFLCWVFGWYFPLLFALVSLMGALWILQAGGRYLGNYLGSTVLVSILCFALTSYVLLFEPVKDYRPYAVGSNLKEKMNDGKEGKYLNLMVYKNSKTGATREYDGSSAEYINSKIWEKPDWKYVSMTTKEIIPTKLPSITGQFDPKIALYEIGDEEREMPLVKKILKGATVPGVVLLDVENNMEMTVAENEYNTNDYDTSFFRYLRKGEKLNLENDELSLREAIIAAPKMFIIFSKKLDDANFSRIEAFKTLYAQTKKAGIPMIMVTNASRDEINAWRQKNHFNIPVFINDETELKAIARSNPSLMVLRKGVVKGKFPHRSLPTWQWIKKHSLN